MFESYLKNYSPVKNMRQNISTLRQFTVRGLHKFTVDKQSQNPTRAFAWRLPLKVLHMHMNFLQKKEYRCKVKLGKCTHSWGYDVTWKLRKTWKIIEIIYLTIKAYVHYLLELSVL